MPIAKGSLKVYLPCNGFEHYNHHYHHHYHNHRYHNITTITISPLSQPPLPQFHHYHKITTITNHHYHNFTIITISPLIRITPQSQLPLWQHHHYHKITTITITNITITTITIVTISPLSNCHHYHNHYFDHFTTVTNHHYVTIQEPVYVVFLHFAVFGYCLTHVGCELWEGVLCVICEFERKTFYLDPWSTSPYINHGGQTGQNAHSSS